MKHLCRQFLHLAGGTAFAGFLMLLSATNVQAEEGGQLLGTWKLKSWVREVAGTTGERYNQAGDGQENYIWVLVLKDESDEAIGVINFRRLEKGSGGNRGFWLAEPYWRRGLMTEAVEAVNDFVFGRLGMTEYYVCNSADNAGSRRVKQKTGAQFVCYVEIAHHSGGTQSERWVVRPSKVSASLPKRTSHD